ncbi:type II toxin-antitoxin system RelE/ParE family toxin [Levilactobacillus tujiorum]|uniref:Type II toxin-antitoxin system RelE/ParE family toxin n=1 Tax=Levilactobacillus tujiorum TaxID=2912243 RepID=A0ABX1L505_9LACO|nr:type II toxin-antitoxin system RelE/ParE family toxin [Levilactobacillus tujiorum]MCH5465151.1 type II toxin-antitoxin system RelE/ParE family toxin [Levilactobacillus tujiorum]NLR12771.1 type II toxin-antitoxin system RelE/ParE family toxin [Lactobacillus sp. HBUAS51387]NLR30116.1 type II toxin-antitoxin system RelE/ParE family toxin [Levilactobacillus tujiorum]
MEKPKFEFYTRPSGHNEFQEFLGSLNLTERQKLITIIAKTQKFGLQVASRQLWIKKVSDGIFELRTTGSNIQRGLYFHVKGARYVITHGFTKKSQKTPISELNHAKELRKEYYDNLGGK